jgi:hypothetical protein
MTMVAATPRPPRPAVLRPVFEIDGKACTREEYTEWLRSFLTPVWEAMQARRRAHQEALQAR